MFRNISLNLFNVSKTCRRRPGDVQYFIDMSYHDNQDFHLIVTYNVLANKNLPNDSFHLVSTKNILVLHVNANIQINTNTENDYRRPFRHALLNAFRLNPI